MRKIILLSILILFCVPAIANVVDTSLAAVVSVSANYTTMMLGFISFLGVVSHLLTDLMKEKQKPAPYVYKWSTYWSNVWPSKALSLVICCAVIIIRHEMMQIPDFSNWEGLAMYFIGFFGGSVLLPMMGLVQKRTGLNIDANN